MLVKLLRKLKKKFSTKNWKKKFGEFLKNCFGKPSKKNPELVYYRTLGGIRDGTREALTYGSPRGIHDLLKRLH